MIGKLTVENEQLALLLDDQGSKIVVRECEVGSGPLVFHGATFHFVITEGRTISGKGDISCDEDYEGSGVLIKVMKPSTDQVMIEWLLGETYVTLVFSLEDHFQIN
ncbi:hypothetical protein [Shimazuella kribbensis]|uniref:hypothetical protein n=1 Tax=Shimazuella kribbensis TaxID=139808 RepID=UPI00040EA1BE|nr:hypothetical protein [Shimazuella kribbensis]